MAKRTHYLLIIIILILATGLRLINLNQSFWLDEASQGQLSASSPAQIWFGRSGDFHPPLYYLIAHFWMQVSHSEIWLRLPSVIFGVLNVWAIFIFSRRLFQNSRYAPYLSAFLLAIAPFHVYYSQEFRSYSLVCLLGTLSMYLFHKEKYIQSALINSLLMYTHYSGIFLIITQYLIWIIYQRKNVKSFILAQFILFVSYLPWFPQFLKQLSSGVKVEEYLPGWSSILSIAPIKTFPVIIFKTIAGRINFLSRYLYGAYIVFVFGVVFSGLVFARKNRQLLLTWAFVPIFLLMAISLVLPQAQPFRVIYVLPALLLLLTQACLRFPKLFITFLVYIAVVGNVTYYTRPRLQREQWRQAITFLQNNSNNQTGIIAKFSDKLSPFYWYSPNLSVNAVIPTYPATAENILPKLNTISSQTTSLYVLEYLGDLTDPSRTVNTALVDRGFVETFAKDFPGVGIIRLYQRI